ncbi:MAG: amidohydrolase family protein [Deltaproteobacteria bacterium]|nr:amidohydrolase family protein [Deltaproteobacteria bacterium]
MATIIFNDCRILDTAAGSYREGSVRVDGQAVAELSERPIHAGNARVVEGRGRVLMPGLIDAHVHASITTINLAAMAAKPASLVALEAAEILRRMLSRGFTTVRDAGGSDYGLAEAVEQGLIEGPRIFYSGRVLSQTGGHGDFRPRADAAPMCACTIHSSGFSHVADGVPAVRRAAREELRRGARQVKIMASGGVASPSDPVWNVQYSPDEMRAIVEEAASWRTYAMAHAYTPEAITRAVDAGVRTIEHGNLIDRTTAEKMAALGAFLVPTLVTYFVIDEIGGALGFPAENQRKVKEVLQAGLASVEIAKAAGVQIGFGTDLLGETHDQQSRELRIRSEVLSSAEILRSATVTNARILGEEATLGVVAEGARADLLLVDGDPLADITVLEQPERIVGVMKAGKLLVDRGV